MLASVQGPRPMRTANQENAEACQVEVVVSPVQGFPGAREAELCSLLRQTLVPNMVLTAHPRTLVTLCVHVQGDDGGVGAMAVNAAMLALTNARVPMKTMVGAVSLGLYRGEEEGGSGGAPRLEFDATGVEEEGAHALALVAYTSEEEGGGPLAMVVRGALSGAEVRQVLEASRTAVGGVLAAMKEGLKKDVGRDARTSFLTTLTNPQLIAAAV